MSNNSYEKKQYDLCLVMPPLSLSEWPSLALGLLKAEAVAAGLTCHIEHSEALFNNMMGLSDIFHIDSSNPKDDYVVEYLFAVEAGIKTEYGEKELEELAAKDLSPTEFLLFYKAFQKAKKIVPEILDKITTDILSYSPKAVGVSSSFHQKNAALAILNRIKEKCPDIVTFMGGANCFGTSGLAVLRTFSFVDLVFFGESDGIFADVVINAINGYKEPLPYGVLRNGDPIPDFPPHRIVKDMNSLPYPDYDDFFSMAKTNQGNYLRELYRFQGIRTHRPAITLEGSRGCWWAEKHPCSFCGLNSDILTSRRKGTERFFNELRYMTEKYGICNVNITDTAMPQQWKKELIPLLEECPEKFNFLIELRTDISGKTIEMIQKNGFVRLQPGIESLSSHVLKLMKKGTTVMNNLQFLKYAYKYDSEVSWNIIYGFPGETNEDCYEQIELFQLIEHYKAPTCIGPVIFTKDSEYYKNSAAYGLKLKPVNKYRFECPQDWKYIEDTAIYFDCQENYYSDEIKKAENDLREAGIAWAEKYKLNHKMIRLEYADTDKGVIVIDTRQVAVARVQMLIGVERYVYIACDAPVTLQEILKSTKYRYSEETVRKAINALIAKNLMYSCDEKYFSLGIRYTFDELKSRDMDMFYQMMCTNAKFTGYLDSHILKKDSNGFVTDETVIQTITAAAGKLQMLFNGNEFVEYLKEGRQYT